MTKKNWFLVAVLVVLAALYVRFFTDWFRPRTIEISYTERTMPLRFQRQPRPLVTFGLDQDYRLTEIKAVPLAAWQTNQAVLPLWHLVSDSGSAPVKVFRYGQPLRGMKPAVAGGRARPLEPNLIYRLFVRAGSIQGWRDFELGANLPGATASPQSPH
ncbi:MAG: hypothetical protein KGJ60_03195 [Verrucomicrobiota bacterium]|nr:hypothetical protein [Verrucomicrobiota bacterium]